MAKLKDTQVDGNLSFTGELLNKDGVNLETAFSNPNLLINSDFRRPINQRGQTEYAATSAKHFTIDRWAASSSLKVTVNDNSITVENVGSTNMYLANKFEDYLPQGDYTLSCNVLSLTGEAWIYSYSDFKLQPGYNTKTLNNVSDLNSFTFGLTAGSKVELEWCKLEQGSIATPFVPRQRGEELALCKRYYWRINDYQLGMFMTAMPVSDTKMRLLLHVGNTLRTTPTVSQQGLNYIDHSTTGWVKPNSVSVFMSNEKYVVLDLTFSSAILTNLKLSDVIFYDGYIALDAEIY